MMENNDRRGIMQLRLFVIIIVEDRRSKEPRS